MNQTVREFQCQLYVHRSFSFATEDNGAVEEYCHNCHSFNLLIGGEMRELRQVKWTFRIPGHQHASISKISELAVRGSKTSLILRGSTTLRWAPKQILFEQWFMVFIDLLIALTVQRVRKIHVKNVLRGRETDFEKFCCFFLFVLNVCTVQTFKKLCGKRYVVIIMQL